MKREPTLAELRRLYDEPHTVAEIAAITGLPATTIWRRLAVSGGTRGRAHHRRVSYNYPPLTDAALRETQEMYVEGRASLNEVAAVLGLTPQTVRRRLLKAGVGLRGHDEAIRLRFQRDREREAA